MQTYSLNGKQKPLESSFAVFHFVWFENYLRELFCWQNCLSIRWQAETQQQSLWYTFDMNWQPLDKQSHRRIHSNGKRMKRKEKKNIWNLNCGKWRMVEGIMKQMYAQCLTAKDKVFNLPTTFIRDANVGHFNKWIMYWFATSSIPW